MGEQTKQEEEEVKDQEVIKPEEKTEEDKKKDEEKAVEEETKPPPPFVLFVDLHCVGCAKKIQRSISKIRGVEGVMIDMDKNEVTIKGIVEPQAVCNRVMKKTKRNTKVISPLPKTEGEPMPEIVASQVSETSLTTLELNINMHCEACADQLKKKILKMKGVRKAEADFATSKVLVTGTMDPEKLVDYVYRRTKKQAKIVPQPQPEPEKKEEEEEKKVVEEEVKPEEKKETGPDPVPVEEEEKKMEEEQGESKMEEQSTMQKMMYSYNYHHHQPLYVIERIPAPQLFSDENPNACSVM